MCRLHYPRLLFEGSVHFAQSSLFTAVKYKKKFAVNLTEGKFFRGGGGCWAHAPRPPPQKKHKVQQLKPWSHHNFPTPLGPDVHIDSAPDLSDLMDTLYHKVADKWKLIGIYLHFPMATLNTIAAENQSDPRKCLMDMLDAWLKRVEPPPTWSSIIKTVQFLGDEQLAKELREKYTPV